MSVQISSGPGSLATGHGAGGRGGGGDGPDRGNQQPGRSHTAVSLKSEHRAKC